MTSPEEKKDRRVCIGKISSAHGVKGLVKIMPYCKDISLLNGQLFIAETGEDMLDITIKNQQSKYILAQIKGITTPEEAKNLKCSLFVPRDTLPEVDDENEFYVEDLVGLDICDSNHGNTPIGSIVSVQNFGAGDLLEIKPSTGGSSYYLPFRDEYVTSVDIKSRTITAHNTELFQML